MELNAYKDTINELIKSASAGKITDVVDICSNLSNDYTSMNSSVVNATKELETTKLENDMLVKANSKLFLQVGSTEKTVLSEELNKGTGAGAGLGAGLEKVADIDIRATLFDEQGGLK